MRSESAIAKSPTRPSPASISALTRFAAGEKDPRPLIWLNEWAAEDLGAKVGDDVTLDYFLWSDEDGLETSSAQFTLAGVVPMSGLGGDQTLTPEYPGISDAADITSWDPPFPVDLQRVRKKDEDYWDQYRAAPKAIVTRRPTRSGCGDRDTARCRRCDCPAARRSIRAAIDPVAAGLTVRNVRADAISAAQGTTDFGEYFLYFSFFLVVSALLLAYLFFAVGLEQRTTEVGVLAAMGFSASAIRRVFIREGAILAAIGAAIGAIAAIGYSALILYGLRTWWVGAVGTTDLVLHVEPLWLAAGVAGALAAGLIALWLGVRAMSRRSARALLKGDAANADATRVDGDDDRRDRAVDHRRRPARRRGDAARSIRPPDSSAPAAPGWWAGCARRRSCCAAADRRARMGRGLAAMFTLGVRHSSVRPARSVLSLALIAFASFVLVSVGAFKKDVSTTSNALTSGTGGFALMAESVAPLMHDPNSPEGRDGLGLRDRRIRSSPRPRSRAFVCGRATRPAA